jgi:hypothetical protein
VQAGGMTWDSTFAEFLADFPVNAAKRSAAGSMIRAGYTAHQGALEQGGDRTRDIAEAFAPTFWNVNWKLTDCILASDLLKSDDTRAAVAAEDASGVAGETPDYVGVPSPAEDDDVHHVNKFVERCEKQYHRLIDTYFGGSVRDLMHPLPDEVTSGLVLRAITGVTSLCRAPHQWSSQFAAGTLRLLAETEIVLAWFRAHPEDFAKYRDYGLGHEKLAWLHVEDLVSSLDKVPDELERVSEKLKERKRDAPVLDVTVVSTESTFTGISLRAMAKEVGLEVLYRTVFQVSSGEIHGEWEPLQRENLQRCANPLHRWHYVPATEPPWIHDPTMPEIVVKMMERLVGIGVGMLGQDNRV